MKKLVLTIIAGLATVVSSQAITLGESYSGVAQELGQSGVQRGNWVLFAALDLNHANTYCQFYSNRLMCVVYEGLGSVWHFYNPLAEMTKVSGAQLIYQGFNSGFQCYRNYDGSITAGLRDNNVMIVGWSKWIARSKPANSNHRVAPKQHRHVEPEELLPPVQDNVG